MSERVTIEAADGTSATIALSGAEPVDPAGILEFFRTGRAQLG